MAGRVLPNASCGYRACLAAIPLTVFLSETPPVHAQLSPPAAPANTMLPLNQVEPRTPITNLPYTIDEPGSYYLTRNISTGGAGITIAANNVTLDMMGFTITGDGGSEDGIAIGTTFGGAATRDVTVRNGTIRRFDVGLIAGATQDCRFSELTIEDCGGYGVSVQGGDEGSENNVFEDAVIVGNGSGGFFCTTGSSGVSGLTIARGRVERNEGPGLYLFVSGGSSEGLHVSDSHFVGNTSRGLFLQVQSGGESSGHTFEGNVVNLNGAEGFEITVVGAGSLSERFSIVDCQVSRNAEEGIRAFVAAGGQMFDSQIIDCEIIRNGLSGVDAAGLSRSRIEGNTVSGNMADGIRLSDGDGNLLVKNIAAGNGSSNFSFGPTDIIGPLISATGVLASTGAEVHPWANFDY